VSSPNDPGNGISPRPPGPPAAGALPPQAAVTERGDGPSRPRGRTQPMSRRQDPAAAHPTPDIEERVNRFISGPAANAQTAEVEAPASGWPEPPPVRSEPPVRPEPPARPAEPPARMEPLRSELPDLSTRPVRPKPPEHQDQEAVGPQRRRIQVGARPSGPVRASMQIRRIDPWTVLKVSLVLSVVLFFVWMIAVALLYLVLGAMGVWSKLNSNVGDLLTNGSTSELVSSGTIFGGAALIGLLNIVLMTAAATVGAFIYNLTTDLVGGVEVTLADRD
jgi:hypothetical protein